MASYKAIKTFSGIIHMKKDEVREINNKELEDDLMSSGLIIAIGGESKAKASQPEESKPKASKKTSKKAVKEDDADA